MKILKMSVADDKSQSHVVVADADIHNGCPPRTSVGGEGCSDKEIVPLSEIESVEVDLVVPDVKVHLDMVKRNCRICYLSMDITNHNSESGNATPIELGCSCKEDLAAAHKHCAEAWFKIKGNKICEICGSIARNVTGVVEVQTNEQWNEANNDGSMVPPTGPAPPAETRHFWHGQRFLNFLLACMVFAFVISWLFHFNMPS